MFADYYREWASTQQERSDGNDNEVKNFHSIKLLIKRNSQMTLTENRINYTFTPVNNLPNNMKIKSIRVLYLELFLDIECKYQLTQAINVIYYLLT
jgi:hypothetical protein